MFVTAIIENEEAYFDFIHDLNRYGIANLDTHSDITDERGWTELTRFEKLPVSAIIEYLGISDFVPETHIVTVEGKEWEETTYRSLEEPLDRTKMQFLPDCEYQTPTEQDYPILISFDYEDTWDRFGKVSIRTLDWFSIKKIPVIRPGNPTFLKEDHEEWTKKYQLKQERLLAYVTKRIK